MKIQLICNLKFNLKLICYFYKFAHTILDPEVVGEVLNVIRSLNKEHNLTMIMVTHQMGFAREISDRVCFFNEGKIFEQGPPEQLFGDPQNERTKQFLHAVLDAN